MDLEAVRAAWDAEAVSFDLQADHGLRTTETRVAWWRALSALLPPAPARVTDLGCGTGSVALLLAAHGYEVVGRDLAPEMIKRAVAKAGVAGLNLDLAVGDVVAPDLEADAFDVVFTRHVLWALPDPGKVLGRWAGLLVPGGRLLLVEGRWDTGAGLPAAALADLLAPHVSSIETVPLRDPALWGRKITDERYALLGSTLISQASAPHFGVLREP